MQSACIKFNKDGSVEVEIIASKKLSINYDINKEGLKREIKRKFEYPILLIRIFLKSAELYYQEMNLYLYRKWLEYEKRFQ